MVANRGFRRGRRFARKANLAERLEVNSAAEIFKLHVGGDL